MAQKKVLVRVDFNVPFQKGSIAISDDSRIRACLPTISYLRERGAKAILCSHLGRPDGEVVEELRMTPGAQRLSELISSPVFCARDCIGREAEEAVSRLKAGDVLMLENLRFHPEEEKNDSSFSKALASLAEVYVNDAFGTAHRAHASTVGVTQHLPAVAGFLMERELEMLGSALQNPTRPFCAILGGAKVSDKIGVLENLCQKADIVIVGGGMAATFLKAQGLEVGGSLVEEDRLELAHSMIEGAKSRGVRFMLPLDVVVADAFDAHARHQKVEASQIPSDWLLMDIGPRSAEAFSSAIEECKTVVWNGPMGVFEWDAFAQGTVKIAEALARLKGATTVVGGGSTAEAVDHLGLADRMTHVSTGGGASLEFLEGRVLPGVAALMDKRE